jgi:hypothetical protein
MVLQQVLLEQVVVAQAVRLQKPQQPPKVALALLVALD